MTKRKYLIGSDPEIFIANDDNSLSSAIGLFGGTKQNPINIGKECAVQEDNILVEFNIPPVDNFEDFAEHINYSKDYIETILKPLNKKLIYSSSELITKDLLTEKGSTVFGCSPSYNVITESTSSIELELLPPEDKKIRSSGFHIHIGYDNPTDEHNDRLVLCYELFVTLPLSRYDNDKHNRRKIYGLIGDCRDKSYGVECRSLGGYFLKDDETLKIVWDGIQKALEFADNSKLSNEEIKEYIQFCIKNNEIITENVDSVLSHLKIEKPILI